MCIGTFDLEFTVYDFFQDTQYPVKYPKILSIQDTRVPQDIIPCSEFCLR